MVLRSSKDVLKTFYILTSMNMYVWPFWKAVLWAISVHALLWEETSLVPFGRTRVWNEKANSVLAFSFASSSHFREITYWAFSTVFEWIINFFKTCSSEWKFWATRDFWINSFGFYWFLFLSFNTVFCLVKWVLKTYSDHEIKEKKYFPIQNSRD